MKIPFKICGLTRPEDVAPATLVGASYLGFIMVPGTPRCISVEQARRLFAVSSLPKVLVVGNLSIAEVQRLINFSINRSIAVCENVGTLMVTL